VKTLHIFNEQARPTKRSWIGILKLIQRNLIIIYFYGRKTHQLIYIRQIIYNKIKKCKTTEFFFQYYICYRGTDTQNIIPTTLEEYHSRQLTIVQYYCLQSLYLNTEEKPTSQLSIHTITYTEYGQRTKVYYIIFIVISLNLIIFKYWN